MARISEYKEAFADILLECMEQGMLDCEIFSELGVCRTTFYRYLKEYPDFKEAYDLGLSKCEAWWVKSLRNNYLAGNDKGFKYAALIMNTKFGYRESQVQNAVTNNTQINIQGNMNVLEGKSTPELLDAIQNNMTFLRDNSVIDIKAIDDRSESDEQD